MFASPPSATLPLNLVGTSQQSIKPNILYSEVSCYVVNEAPCEINCAKRRWAVPRVLISLPFSFVIIGCNLVTVQSRSVTAAAQPGGRHTPGPPLPV